MVLLRLVLFPLVVRARQRNGEENEMLLIGRVVVSHSYFFKERGMHVV